jgi:hypothetical protein
MKRTHGLLKAKSGASRKNATYERSPSGSIELPKLRDKREMLSSGLGELRGTSTMQTPALSNAAQIDSASAG